MSILRELNKL
jgi:hypothetical protein